MQRKIPMFILLDIIILFAIIPLEALGEPFFNEHINIYIYFFRLVECCSLSYR